MLSNRIMAAENYPIIRPALRRLLNSVNPQEVRESTPGSLHAAQEHFRKGLPIWSFFSHMSKADGPHELKFLSKTFPGSEGRIVMPIAQHTYDGFKKQGVLKLTDIAYGIKWFPVVTRKTIELHKGEDTIGGLRSYLDEAAEATRSGGIVAAALQAGGNLPRYGEPTHVFSSLVRRMRKLDVIPNVGIQFVGIVPKRSLNENHGAQGGQFLRRMRLNIGEFVTLPDLLMHVSDSAGLDQWAHNRMKTMLPAWYTQG